jgi:defect-in-organelle-trafficking protein DotA
MKRLFLRLSVLISLFLPSFAWAADVIGQLTSHNIFTPPVTDKSVNYLGQIFGNVGGIVSGTNTQLLGHLFYVFNYAMVIVASCILIYTLFMSVINTAQEGEFMGRKMNSVWVIVRAVVGIGILVPKYTGYSLIQVFVMWAAVQGIGLADKAWTVALEHLEQGGVVYAEAGQSAYAAGVKNTFTKNVTIFDSEVCMYKLQSLAQGQRDQNLAALRQDPNNPLLQQQVKQTFPQYSPKWNDDAKTVSFGTPASPTVCGEYKWVSSDAQKPYEQYLKAGLQQIVTTLAPAAKSVISTQDGLVAKNSTADQQKQAKFNLKLRVADALLTSTADYETVMQPALLNVKQSANTDLQQTFAKAKDHGWIVAGSYYWDLAKVNNKLTSALTNYQPTGQGVSETKLKNAGVDSSAVMSALSFRNTTVNTNTLSDYLGLLDNMLGGKVSPQYKASLTSAAISTPNKAEAQERAELTTQAVILATKYASTDDQKPIPDSLYNGTVGALSVAAAGTVAVGMLSMGVGTLMASVLISVGTVIAEWFRTMNTVGDPIVMLQALGNSMVGIAMGLWLVGSAMLGLATGFASIMGSATGLGFGIQNGLKLFVPVVVGIVAVLFINGIMLSVYVPLIPFMIFTFAAIGWMIAVLEAMVAAPLVAAAITHPEGHDLLGKAEQAVMLLMGVFLRPVVMIIGFLAAIILARVSLKLVNLGFSHIIEASGMTAGGWNLFVMGGAMIVYTMIVISLVNMVFTAGVVKLWETIWMWVGFHQPSSSVDQAMGEVKSGLHGGAQAAGDAGSTAMKSAQDVNAAVQERADKEGSGAKKGINIAGETKN